MPASNHPTSLSSQLPPSALELKDDVELGWGEESAVFELPAPEPLPPFDDTPAQSGAFGRGSLEALALEVVSLEVVSLEAVSPAAAAPYAVAPLQAASPAAAAPIEDVGRLFSNYRAYVAKIGRRILGPTSEVDDLIQDVFLTTLRDAHKIKDPARLGAWLGTVTTRMAKRRRFRESHRPVATEGLDELVDVARDDGPGPESTADLTGNIRKLLSLPDELRTPWLLKHVEGHTLEDVARQCDCSLSTAARRIQSANSKLTRRR